MIMVTKKYFTWIEQVGVNGHKVHIKPQVDSSWKKEFIEIQETSYGNTSDDSRMLGIAIFDKDRMTKVTRRGDTLLDRFKNEVQHNWSVYTLTPQEALELCKEWYGDHFVLDEDGFTLIDNRPEEPLI